MFVQMTEFPFSKLFGVFHDISVSLMFSLYSYNGGHFGCFCILAIVILGLKKKDLFIYVKYVVTDKEEDLEKSLFKIFYLFLKDKYDK